jgi:O-antigen ligase
MIAGRAGVPIALGLLYPATAYFGHPAALPLVLAAVALAVVTVRRLEVGVAAAFVLLALDGLAVGGSIPGLPPWLPATLWTGFVFVLALLRPTPEDRLSRPPRPLSGVVAVYLAVLVAGLALSPGGAAAAPLVRSAVVGMMLFYVVATHVYDRRQAEWVLGGIVAGGLVMGGYGVWQTLHGGSGSGFITSTGELVGRAAANFGHPNQLAGFLVLLVPLAVAGALSARRGRLFHLVAAVLALVAIYGTFSRGALIALAVVPLLFLRGRGVLLLVPLAGAGLLVVGPQLLEERFATGTRGGPELAARMDFWRTAGTIWTDHPVLGTGLGTFPTAYAEARVPGKQFLPDTVFEPPPHAHSLPLHLLAEQGLVGLVAFGAVLAAAGHRSRVLRLSSDRWLALMGSALMAALGTFLIHNLFDVTLLERTGSYFWGILGLLSAVASIDIRAVIGTESADDDWAPAGRAGDALATVTP